MSAPGAFATRGPQPPSPWLETLRIELSEYSAGEYSDLIRLDTDPRVMKYIGNARVATPADVRATINRVRRAYAVYPGLGNWRATRRDDGAYIGWFALKYVPGTVEVEVGYRLLPEAWGQGLATEGATELLRYGFEELGLERIIGITHPDNAASQRVLLKSGLKDAGWSHYYGFRVRRYLALRGGR